MEMTPGGEKLNRFTENDFVSRYFGAGFDKHECGITVEGPQTIDKTQWKCLIGVEEMGESSTIGAMLDASKAEESRYDIDVEDVYGFHNSAVSILCRANFPSEYCWFRHASGQKISVSELAGRKEATLGPYRYFGNGVKLGECGITVMNATVNDTGTWSCHMGTTSKSGVEQSKDINVRISGTSETHKRALRLVTITLFYCRNERRVALGRHVIIRRLFVRSAGAARVPNSRVTHSG